MRGLWLLGAVAGLAGFSLAASCFLPAANVGSGGAGVGGAATGGTGTGLGTSSGGAGLPANPVQITIPMTDPITAPSGTPGERHLFHAGSSWWLFFLRTPGELDWTVANDGAVITWNVPMVATTMFTFGDALSFDGRAFGIDVQLLDTNPGLHLSLSNSAAGMATTKSSMRGTAFTGTNAIVGLGITPIGTLTTAGLDGTVAAVTTNPMPPYEAIDFGATAPDAGLVPVQTAIQITDTSNTTTIDGVSALGSGVGVVTRAALPLGLGFVTIWNDLGNGLVADVFTNNQWKGAVPLEPSATKGVGREWAACGVTGDSASAHVVWWHQGVFSYAGLAGVDGLWTPGPSAPPPLPAQVKELFLACGPSSIYVFTVVSPDMNSSPFAVNTIVMSSWSYKPSAAWAPWQSVVPPVGMPTSRCFLAGYDRVVPAGGTRTGPQIGLLWTESSKTPPCVLQEPTDLWMAVVPVPAG